MVSIGWLTVGGLTLDLGGVILMAWDLIDRPARASFEGLDDLSELVYELVDETAVAIERGDSAKLRSLRSEANSIVLAHTATRNLQAGRADVLRKRGWYGLGAIILGFLVQILGALLRPGG